MFRHVCTGILSLVLAFLFLGVLVLKNMDWKKHYCFFITQHVAETTGRRMVIRGGVDIRLSFRPVFVMHDIALSNAPWGSRQDMITAKKCEVQIALWPLFGGYLHVRRLTLIEPYMIVEIARDRQSNWMLDLPKTRVREWLSSHRSITLPALHLTSFTVKNATIIIRFDSAYEQQYTFKFTYFLTTTFGVHGQNVLSFEGKLGRMPIRGQGKVGAIADLLTNRPFAIDLAITTADVAFSMRGVIARPLEGTHLNLSIQTYGIDCLTGPLPEHEILLT